MRVGQFLAHYPASGGSTSVLVGLSSGLLELGHDVVVYGYGPPCDGAPLEGVLERTCRSPRIAARGLVAVSPRDALARAIAANQDELDVLIIHGMFSAFSPRLARAARAAGISTIAQPHDPYTPAVFAERSVAKWAYWYAFERTFLRSVDAIQLYAPAQRGYLIRLGVKTPTFVVPAAISSTALEHAATARRNRKTSVGEPVRMLFVARFDIYNKGLDLLLETIASTPILRSCVVLDCVGARNQEEYAAADRIVRGLGLSDCMRLSCRTDDPWSAFAEADLFVLPSRFDGFAQVVLEALAVGTPAVVSSAAGAAEFVGDDPAVIVAQPYVEDLRRALLDARSRLPELRAAAGTAHERMASSLTWKACAERWLEGITELRLGPPQARIGTEVLAQ